MGRDDQYNKPSMEYWTVCYIFPILALLSLGDFKGHFRWWTFPIIWVVMIPVLMVAYSSVMALIVATGEKIRMRTVLSTLLNWPVDMPAQFSGKAN